MSFRGSGKTFNMERILECVPNFSEGRDPVKIRQITDAIKSVPNVQLLDADPGKGANRTVVTFAGDPEGVIDAAFSAVAKAASLIDMRKHQGEHPRFGATDVCPLIPVRGISMEETVDLARRLGERIGRELNIPVYCYENAAFTSQRGNLAHVRSGGYEGLKAKLSDPGGKPDYGPAEFNPETGAIAVGARDFLVAYNVNLNTGSVGEARLIARDVREKGSVKAIGWFIEEYGIAQVSMNLTNLSVTPMHVAFQKVSERAGARGLIVTGSEVVGLVLLKPMLDAGKFYLKRQNLSPGIAEHEIIRLAVKYLGLDDLYPFKPEKKIIEYRLQREQ